MKKIILLLIIPLLFNSCSSSKKISNTTTPEQTIISKNVARDGSSYEKAIIIKEKTESTGVAAEYNWLKENYPGYKTKMQSLNYYENKPFDIIIIITKQGEEKQIYFDISNFYGKF